MENFIFCAVFWDNRDHPKKCCVKELFLEILQNAQEITPVPEPLSF